MAAFEYIFPSIRGVQAEREYYVSMCPLRLIPRIFSFDEEELSPELRAQRVLNKARVPEMGRYILDNRDSYVFSALTASLDADVTFEPSNELGDQRMGLLHVPMDARFLINDGQHRRAAIELALRENPSLGDETIAVVFFLDIGLDRCQQMFADLNRYAIRPSTSLSVLYDHRDSLAILTKRVIFSIPLFKDVVETERTTLSPRSRKLFTLSSIYRATKELVKGCEGDAVDAVVERATSFWSQVAKQFSAWQQVRDLKVSAGEIRAGFIHTHAIVLQAIGRAGHALLHEHPNGWKRKLGALRKIDWSRTNAALWEGRAIIGGRVSKSSQNVVLTTNVIKEALGLSLSPEERRLEAAFQRGNHDRATGQKDRVRASRATAHC